MNVKHDFQSSEFFLWEKENFKAVGINKKDRLSLKWQHLNRLLNKVTRSQKIKEYIQKC